MGSRTIKIIIIGMILINCNFAESKLKPAVTEPIPIGQLKDYSSYSSTLKNLINEAWILSSKKLTYQYGSADPNNKGMDCSGTMYFLLKNANISDVPRDSNEMYEWVKKSGHFYNITNQTFSSSEFSHLKPGDLLFWSGTYNKTAGSITHVMLYLGRTTQDKPIMFGASDGRSYEGKKMWGVSVFDFQLPNGNSKSKFEGYSCIPNLTCE